MESPLKLFSRGKLFRILAFIFILLSFEAQAQVAGISKTTINPFVQQINIAEESSHQPVSKSATKVIELKL